MDKQSLKAEPREIKGRKVKKLREKGVLPANIYGKKIKSQAVKVDLLDFEKVFRKTGETGLVELTVKGKKRPVLIHNVQTDPMTDSFVHADFLQVDLKQKVVAQVPIDLSGEAPAEKQGLGTVVQHLDEIEVEALPADLPDKFDIDLATLSKVDDAIYVKDLPSDKKVEIKNDSEQMIVKVEALRKEEEAAPVEVEEEAEVSAEGEEAPTTEEKKEGEQEKTAPEEKSLGKKE